MRRRGFFYNLSKYKMLYVMLIPTVVFLIVFNYAPLWGLRMAFYNYNPRRGFAGSSFIGLQNFVTLFNMSDFPRQIWNTIIINVYKIIFGFPAPILFALLLDEIHNSKFKRTVQTISYLPHFISWVIVNAIMYALINGHFGILNNFIKALGGDPPKWYVEAKWWRGILVITDIWKGVGFGSILYLAAISNINSEMYEAAVIDGAGRFKQVYYITIPSIVPTIVVMFILSVGGMMSGNFHQVYALVGGNSPLYPAVDTLDMGIYRLGLQRMQFSIGTAMGIFQSVISFILVAVTNKIANKIGDYGLW
ncbi:MAG: ABC transporter permease [Christensenellales bacterium]